MNDFDVLIFGAGPAGSTTAFNLAPHFSVAIVDPQEKFAVRIGESLPPVARRLFADLGLLESFLAQGHAPSFGNRSRWGNSEVVETDFLRDPDGHGWHLDRLRFDDWLRQAAINGGAQFIAGRLAALERKANQWKATITTENGPSSITACVIIDASGRAAVAAHYLGLRRTVEDRLVCGWMHGRETSSGESAGFSYIQSTENGWWYSAPLPNGLRVLAVHTDANLPSAGAARNPKTLLVSALAVEELADLLRACKFEPSHSYGFSAAHGAISAPIAGQAWLAVGDAAMSFDPLSGQGLVNALYTGLTAAKTVASYLAGDANTFAEYERNLIAIWEIYRQRLAEYYYSENRWPRSPFWRRRRAHILGALARGSPRPLKGSAPPFIAVAK